MGNGGIGESTVRTTIFARGVNPNQLELLQITLNPSGTSSREIEKIGDTILDSEGSFILGFYLNQEGTQLQAILSDGSLAPGVVDYGKSMYQGDSRKLQFFAYNTDPSRIEAIAFGLYVPQEAIAQS